MTTPRDADRILRAWLDLMPDEAPDRVIDAVLQAVETTPQKRRPLVRGSRRFPRMNRLLLLAAAATLGAALLGGALLMGGSRTDPAPSAAPDASPAAVVVTSPAATIAPVPLPAPSAIRGNWVAETTTPAASGADPAGDGFVRLTVATNGSAAWAQGTGGSAGLRSTSLDAGAADEVLFSLERAGAGCDAGALGRYRWQVADAGLHLELLAVDDPCAARAAAFVGTWTRSHNGLTAGGEGVITGVGPLIQVTLPEGSYTQRALTDVAEIDDAKQGLLLYVFKDPQAFADPCATTHELAPWAPGARAFVDAIRANPAMTEVRERAMTIGGAPAIEVTLKASTSYPVCGSGDPFLQWTPRTTPAGGWWLSAGDSDRFFVVDAPGATLLVQVLEIDAPSLDGIISSISFPGTLAP
jgi:hypothetical protein